jgi:hypothetical protein
MPTEDDFADLSDFTQAQKDFVTKHTKWNTLHEFFDKGLARKVVMLDNLTTGIGYIMQEKETVKEDREGKDKPTSSNRPVSPTGQTTPQSPKDNQSVSTVSVENRQVTIKPDLLSTLLEKDEKNREEALYKVIDDTRKLVKDTEIPPVEITPFEEALMYFVMLEHLDPRHFDFFGIVEGQIMTEDVKFGLYTTLNDEQKNVLKRDFIIKHMIQRNGISKRTALLIELAKLHFPDEVAAIEHEHNDEYMKKRQVIQEQVDKINAENEEFQEVA